MDFLNFLSELFVFTSSQGAIKSEKKNLLNRILFNISLIIGVIWIVIEIQNIQYLENPFVFVGLTMLTSLAIFILVLIGLFKLEIFDSLTIRNLFFMGIGRDFKFYSFGKFIE